MGTFEKIRKISPYMFGVFAVLLVAYFVFTSGAEDIMKEKMNPQSAVIGSINGEDILRTDFEKLVRDAVEQQKNQSKDKDVQIDETEIRNQVWSQLVEDKLVLQYSQQAGIIVTDNEILDILIDNPPQALTRPFTDSTGNFNRQVYLELLTKPENLVKYMGADPSQIPQEQKEEAINDWRKNLILITDYLRKQKLTESLTQLVNTSQGLISQGYAQEKFVNENGKANLNYISFNVTTIQDNQVTVTDKDIKNYYDDHKQFYKQKPMKKIKYVSFPIVPSKDDSAQANKKVDKIITEFRKGSTIESRDSIFEIKLEQFGGKTNDFTLVKDVPPDRISILAPLSEREVVGPLNLADGVYFFRLDGRRQGENEIVKASHILIKFGENKDSAKTIAENILQQAKSGGDFAMLAKENSEDKGSAMQGGDVGYFTKGKMVKPFEDAAFGAKIGEIVGPVESQFGYHIIKVDDKKSDEISYSELQVSTKVSTATRNLLKREAISLIAQFKAGEKFDTLAHRLKKNPVETAFFERTRPILGSRYLTDIAFESKVGTILDPEELENQGFIVALVLDEREEGLKPLKDMKDEIKRKVLNIKKLDLLKNKAEAAYNKIVSSGNLMNATNFDNTLEVKQANEIKNNGMVPGLGQEWMFTSQAFIQPVGAISKPIRGERGYYIMQVVSRDIPDQSIVSRELPAYLKQLETTSKQSIYYQWFQKMKEEADIQDFRSKFYREY